jgi:apolipoprotein N-acyltransferase
MKTFLLFLFGSFSLILTQYPFYFFPASLFAFVPLLIITKNSNNKKTFLISFLYTFPFFFIHLNWLYNLDVGKSLGILLVIGVSFMIILRTILFCIWFLLFKNSKNPIFLVYLLQFMNGLSLIGYLIYHFLGQIIIIHHLAF